MDSASQEFMFLRDKLKKIANLVMLDEKIEAAFMIGCLHSLCHENSIKFASIKDLEKEANNNED